MIIKSVDIKNFRNIKSLILEFCDGINVIYGQNAQGKTNLLEALWCLTGAKSFRTSKDSELINLEKENAEIKISFFDEGRDQECIIKIDKKRSAVLNGVEYKSASQLAGKFNAVVFSPQDIGLIKEGPSFRRKFLDLSICQSFPVYLNLLKNYNRTLDQRNKILKDLKYNPSLEDFIIDFEIELSKIGSQIIKYRKEFVEKLKKFLPDIYKGISDGKEEISIFYETTADEDENLYLEKLKEKRKEDVFNFSTSVGPHRDDLEIKINGLNSRNFSSQGQKRSAAIALKLAESAVISEITGTSPIALLDDVMSELDLTRQNYILNHIKGWQVFITCCDPNNINGLENGKVFYIENGEVK